ncbi:right-handed parallel beta-helix repeat-containing protein [Compostibacter hankyongensis]
MKSKLIHTGLFILLIVSSVCSAAAQSVYVAPDGNDKNPGTKTQPLATLQAACDRARDIRGQKPAAGSIEILVAPGTYFLKKPLLITAAHSGTAASPLLIKGEGPEPSVISGGVTLPPFEQVSEKLWKIHIPDLSLYGGTIQQLFVNGKRAVRARTPNEGAYFKTGAVSETPDQAGSGTATQRIDLTPEQSKALEGVNAAGLKNTILSVYHAWDMTRKYIQRYAPQDTALFITGHPMHPWNKLDNNSQFIFENAKAFLDAPGEWFLDPAGTLYYIPRAGEKMSDSRATVPILETLLVIRGDEKRKAEHIRFENLSFRFTRYVMDRNGNEPAQAASPTGATVIADYASDIRLDRCEIAHTGNNAIWFRTACRDSRITHCYLHELGIGGVKIGEIKLSKAPERLTRNITVDNNIIRSGGYEFPTGVGVLIFNAGDNTISHNEIADFRYSGISVGWVWGYTYSPSKRNRIVYNHIHHLGWGLLSDMGGVYTLGPSEGTTVSNNVIHHVYAYGYGGWGLYTDEGSTGVVMENNLVYQCKSSAFHQHYGKDNIIRNNIFALNIRAQLEATRVEDHRSFSFTNNIVYFNQGVLIGKPGWIKAHFFANHNCYWDTRTRDILFGQQHFAAWQDSTGKDRQSVIADPEFANPAEYDFHIRDRALISKIGFKPFDYTQAGVYGDASWKKLALFDRQSAEKFDEMIRTREREQRSGAP